VQGIALAWDAQSEWRDTPRGKELRVHLLFNHAIHAAPESGLTEAAPIAAELWSHLPYEGRVTFRAHQPISRVALRLPDGTDLAGVTFQNYAGNASDARKAEEHPNMDGQYAIISNLAASQGFELLFPLNEYETLERAAGKNYRVQWKGSTVLSLVPPGEKVPLYAHRAMLRNAKAPLCAPRYSR